MLKRLVDITHEIYLSHDRSSLFKALQDGCANFGFEQFVLCCHKRDKLKAIIDPTLSNFAPSFLQDYEGLGWASDDSVVQAIIETESPFSWNSSTDSYANARSQSFFEFLTDSQMPKGVAVPLKHRQGTVSAFGMTTMFDRVIDAPTIHAAIIMANAAMSRAEMLGLCPDISPDEAATMHALTPVQQEILNWVAEGKSNRDIATILETNERAIRYHVTEILRKLGVATRMQAAALRRASA